MLYLTYEEYLDLGGENDVTAFDRNIVRACKAIDAETHGRVAGMRIIPDEVKCLCRDLVDFLATSAYSVAGISSKSQTAGGVSESVTFGGSDSAVIQNTVEAIIFDYLSTVKNDEGVPLLYRGINV